MSSTNKYRILFVAICLFIGFAIYMNSGTPTEYLNSKKLDSENVTSITIERINDKKNIIYKEPSQIQSLIKRLITSEKIRIKDVRSSRRVIYCKIHLTNDEDILFKFQESKIEGKFIREGNYFYKNDSLFNELSSLFDNQ